VHPPPLKLAENGKMLRHYMRRELRTEDELMSMIRQQGINDIQKVKEAFIEGDGRISVITDEVQSPKNSDEKRPV
jgi:uncharacterized membrane protein YcaP (DUF421 family)